MTGTNTEVGKTYVSALLARTLVSQQVTVGVYKPVASGCLPRNGHLHSDDAEQLWQAAGKPLTVEAVTPQRFVAAVAPNVAARLEGRSVCPTLLREGLHAWKDYDVTIVEGVGGLMSPISDQDLVVDLAVDFEFPVLIVVANELGCINQTLQTIEVARARGLEVKGIVLNAAKQSRDVSCETNRNEIVRWTDIPIVATVGWGDITIDLTPLFKT